MELKMGIDFNKIDIFCKINDFVIINDELLCEEGMYKKLVYATKDNFIGRSVYPENMPIIINTG